MKRRRRWRLCEGLERRFGLATIATSSVARARELGFQVWTWTVNAPAELERVLDLGVDAMTTDWPDHVVNYLAAGTWSE